ncbi:MAG TPA: nuclear transport factor 2 family protein, partial [Acidimicrobiales bacterium]|nr:nuclear transport factor 2 family protein [Acidimicrobiales bacterium]
AADCFTEDLFYSHPPYSAEHNGGLRHEVRGRAALIELFQARGHRPVSHEIRSSATDGSVAFVQGVFTVNGEVGGSFVSVVELAADGRIASYAAYASVPAVGVALAPEAQTAGHPAVGHPARA